MSNDIDILMEHVKTINTKTALDITDNDIDILIAYHRHNRARRAAGHKPTKPDGPKLDILKMLDIRPTPTVPAGTVRRPGSGPRRPGA